MQGCLRANRMPTQSPLDGRTNRYVASPDVALFATVGKPILRRVFYVEWRRNQCSLFGSDAAQNGGGIGFRLGQIWFSVSPS